MTVYRCILPDYAKDQNPTAPKVMEGQFSQQALESINKKLYNIYYLPNYPSIYNKGETVEGHHIDTFQWCFVDMDLKEGVWNKDTFLDTICSWELQPTKIVDSGNGIHAYWKVTDLDAQSFLKLQRRLCRHFRSDEAVSKIYQLMRVPGTFNTKTPDEPKECVLLAETDLAYSCEQLDNALPPLSQQDADYCKAHYEKTYRLNQQNVNVDDKIPLKFSHLIKNNKEVKDIWSGKTEDRSKADYRLGHIMFANDFTRDEAMSVLVNSAKALDRAPVHRINYAMNIVDKIWTFETEENTEFLELSQSVASVLNKYGTEIKGKRFHCHRYLDDTSIGFRLGHVFGMVAGSGVGKTAIALNMFEGFVLNNPDYDHFFVSLEQPINEIADRWKALCGDRVHMHEKVQLLGNYNPDGTYRHLSLEDIEQYIIKYQEVKKRKVGCIVVDHIGVLKGDLMDICRSLKAFALRTSTFFVIQSQAPRDKAGIGDLELNKDAAYGTVFFESFCDYLMTIWQPLKRCHKEEGCPTTTAFKFGKIRHKKPSDKIQEDELYIMYFDQETQRLRQMTQDEEKSFDFFNKKCVNIRKQDRKTEVLSYKSVSWQEGA